MMKRLTGQHLLSSCACLLMALCLLAGVTAVAHAAVDPGFTETVVSIEAEGHVIPATLTLPTGEGKHPAVVMLHGTGSNRDEAGGGYKIAAPVLASQYGIATLRIDFIGNGESTADYMDYHFTSAVADAVKAAEYLTDLEEVDGEKLGVMGWSQGGTIALLTAARHPELFKAVVTWAGAPNMYEHGFPSREQAEEAKANGFFVLDFDWRPSLNVSRQWCEDVINTDVLGEFASFPGPVLAVHGAKDDTVPPTYSDKIVAASPNAASAVDMIEGMDHTFNVFTEPELTSLAKAVNDTGAFFQKQLK